MSVPVRLNPSVWAFLSEPVCLNPSVRACLSEPCLSEPVSPNPSIWSFLRNFTNIYVVLYHSRPFHTCTVKIFSCLWEYWSESCALAVRVSLSLHQTRSKSGNSQRASEVGGVKTLLMFTGFSVLDSLLLVSVVWFASVVMLEMPKTCCVEIIYTHKHPLWRSRPPRVANRPLKNGIVPYLDESIRVLIQ